MQTNINTPIERLKNVISVDHRKLDNLLLAKGQSQEALHATFEKVNLIIQKLLIKENLSWMTKYLNQKIETQDLESQIRKKTEQVSEKEKVAFFSWLYLLEGSRNGLRVLKSIPDDYPLRAISPKEWETVSNILNRMIIERNINTNALEVYTQKMMSLILAEFRSVE